MKLESTKAQMKKGILEYCILRVIEGKPIYVSEIIQNLERSELIVVEGTLYPILIRLKNEGYLGYRWKETLQGPPRKYYELTEPGKLFLDELGKFWNELVDAVFQINNQQ